MPHEQAGYLTNFPEAETGIDGSLGFAWELAKSSHAGPTPRDGILREVGSRRGKATGPNAKRPYNRRFMEQMLRTILADARHPLGFLVDRRAGHWRATTPWTDAAQHYPAVQAGHGDSSWVVRGKLRGARERLYIEDAHQNQLMGRTVERQGGYIKHGGVLLGGVPVELNTARLWVKYGFLPARILARAPYSPGWTP